MNSPVFKKIIEVSKKWGYREYWTKTNIVEAFAFMIKIVIIFPGLIFAKQWWWLYIFALVSSSALIITSTIKTMPTVIWFNIFWIILAVLAITKHFFL